LDVPVRELVVFLNIIVINGRIRSSLEDNVTRYALINSSALAGTRRLFRRSHSDFSQYKAEKEKSGGL